MFLISNEILTETEGFSLSKKTDVRVQYLVEKCIPSSRVPLTVTACNPNFSVFPKSNP